MICGDREDMPRFAYGAAAAIVAVLALLPALIYVAIAYRSHAAAVETEAEIYGRLVTQVINDNPEMWRYENLRMGALLPRRSCEGHAEAHRIRDTRGTILLEDKDRLAPPVITRSRWLYDSGTPVGRLEISRSLRPMAVRTGVLVLIGAGFGLAAFFILRALPLTMVHEALESLSREKGRAEVTLRSIGDGVVTTGTDGRVAFINRAAEAILGWSREEAVGRPIGEIYHMPGCCEGKTPCAALPGGAHGTAGGRRRTISPRNGAERIVEESAAPIVGRQGRPVGCVLVFRDVTEKVRMEEELVRVQKLESLGILAGGIAHEIRNPLSGINIYLSALERLCEQSEGLDPGEKRQIEEIMSQVRAASDKIAVIIRRVMEFAKPSPRLADKIDLNRSIEEAILITGTSLRQKGIALEKSLRPDLPGCVADARLMVQVLLNLVLNAVQALQAGGEKRIAIASSVEDGRVVITVSDSGPGVPDHLREKIFDPFFTTKAEGSGIGLSFSRRVVAEHGGTLSVATSRWGGAEFRIGLPVQREPVPV